MYRYIHVCVFRCNIVVSLSPLHLHKQGQSQELCKPSPKRHTGANSIDFLCP